jgi:hypothetical protein
MFSLLDSSSGPNAIEYGLFLPDFLDPALGGKIGDHFFQKRLLLTGRRFRQPILHDPFKRILRVRSSGQVGEYLPRYP